MNDYVVNQTVADRVKDKTQKKKILACDGGGIRGMVSVEVIAEIEAVLRKETGAGSDFVLSDYFDFFAGTSTGAIIACCLSSGMSAAQIRDFYVSSGKDMFHKNSLLARSRALYSDDPLSKKLAETFGKTTELGTDTLNTLLLMVMHNVNTDSPWLVNNNPFDKYNNPSADDCNLKLSLTQLVRASTAAPIYFPPEKISFGDYDFVFQDGGISPYNNPAFAAFTMATTEPYNINWKSGVDDLLVVSIGTGYSASIQHELDPGGTILPKNMARIPGALMNSVKAEQDLLCRVFGNCLEGEEIDGLVGDLIGAKGPTASKLFTYMRYDFEIENEGLERIGISGIDPKKIAKLDAVSNIDDLQKIGEALGKRVDPEHYKGFV